MCYCIIEGENVSLSSSNVSKNHANMFIYKNLFFKAGMRQGYKNLLSLKYLAM